MALGMNNEISSKLINLFEFVKEMNLEKINLNFFEGDDIRFSVLLSDKELDKFNRNYVKTNFSSEADYYFSVQLPDLLPLPSLPNVLSQFVLPFDESIEPKINPDFNLTEEELNRLQTKLQGFIDKEYKPWQEKQRVLLRTRKYFYDLYEGLYKVLQQSDGMYDLFLGRVWLKGTCGQGTVNYPLLMQPVNIEFDTKKSRLQVERGFRNSLRNDQLLMRLGLGDSNYINDRLSSDLFKDNILEDFARAINRQAKGSQSFSVHDGFVLFLKNKNLNLSTAINAIVDDLKQQSDNHLPQAIKQFVKPVITGVATDNSAFDVNKAAGYDIDALLAKPANEAQIKLVKSLARVSHVLVQGPPGTGKTHTIANLIGHLLSEGKSVLVSSYTSKALRVLREKLPIKLQDYCVTVFPDSNPEDLISKTVNRVAEDHAYIVNEGTSGLQAEIKRQQDTRRELLKKASDIRKELYKAVLQEKQANVISIGGESISLSKAAAFVSQHKGLADNIPGKIETGESGLVLPLTEEELSELYSTNISISADEEFVLTRGLPNPSQLLAPKEFQRIKERIAALQQQKRRTTQKLRDKIQEIFVISEIDSWTLKKQSFQGKDLTRFCEQIKKRSLQNKSQSLTDTRRKLLRALIDNLNYLHTKQKWEQDALYDYMCGNEEPWQQLANEIQEFVDIFHSNRTLLITRPNIECNLTVDQQGLLPSLRIALQKQGKISRWLQHSLYQLQHKIKINGQVPQSAEDVMAVQITLQLRQLLSRRIGLLWKNLDIPIEEITKTPFNHLYNIFSSMVKNIAELKNTRKHLLAIFLFINQSGDFTIPEDLWKTLSSKDVFWDLLLFTYEYQKGILELDIAEEELGELRNQLVSSMKILNQKQYSGIDVCHKLLVSIQNYNTSSYNNYWKELSVLIDKKSVLIKRQSYLAKLKKVAPQWAEAIRRREGLHGKSTLEFDPAMSWKYKTYEAIIRKVQAVEITKLQDTLQLTERRIREVTEQLIENLTKISIVDKILHTPQLLTNLQALQSSFKKLGKGKGKMSAQIKNQILNLTNKAKDAIPVWVMPLGAALEQFSPAQTRFDVLILDEASQLDLKALVLIYMAKKVVIVGDDAQITPNTVGTTIDNLNSLYQKYHLIDYFPDMYHLFSPEYSIYDFAQHSNFMPIMLTEHFRCVPDIIGFSNALSYGNKIKPLRDASRVQRKPAMIAYQVPFGEEEANINLAEAQQIVSLIYGCLRQPEYKDATFGVISLRKDEQTKCIMNLLLEYLGAQCCEQHRILCGLSRDFQGDERDVMFLSMVDSPKKTGQSLRLQTAAGKNDFWKKMYNVAVSRAKDQLWVVHSLTKEHDLQPSDIRRTLLEWVETDAAAQEAKLQQQSGSVFETEVGKALSERGYKLEAQVRVGAYRIDLVASYKDKKVAIECDGEAYHSSPEQIQADMHRQAILERCGWCFERLRGSYYYGDKQKAIEYLVKRLNTRGIYPESAQQSQNSDVLERVKISAQQFMQEHFIPKEENTDIQINQ